MESSRGGNRLLQAIQRAERTPPSSSDGVLFLQLDGGEVDGEVAVALRSLFQQRRGPLNLSITRTGTIDESGVIEMTTEAFKESCLQSLALNSLQSIVPSYRRMLSCILSAPILEGSTRFVRLTNSRLTKDTALQLKHFIKRRRPNFVDLTGISCADGTISEFFSVLFRAMDDGTFPPATFRLRTLCINGCSRSSIITEEIMRSLSSSRSWIQPTNLILLRNIFPNDLSRLANIKGLESLRLDVGTSQPVSEELSFSFLRAIQSCKSLIKLDLRESMMDEESLRSLFEWLEQQKGTGLEELLLNWKPLEESVLGSVVPCLRANDCLKILKLNCGVHLGIYAPQFATILRTTNMTMTSLIVQGVSENVGVVLGEIRAYCSRNWSGRRLLKDMNVPPGLWPIVLGRISTGMTDMTPNERIDSTYHMLRSGTFLHTF